MRIPTFQEEKEKAFSYVKENSVANCLMNHLDYKGSNNATVPYLKLCLDRCQGVSLDEATLKSILNKMARLNIAYKYLCGTYGLSNIGEVTLKEAHKENLHNHATYSPTWLVLITANSNK